jgi:hypothetical protein
MGDVIIVTWGRNLSRDINTKMKNLSLDQLLERIKTQLTKLGGVRCQSGWPAAGCGSAAGRCAPPAAFRGSKEARIVFDH